MLPQPPISTLFPYTTLFRSPVGGVASFTVDFVLSKSLIAPQGKVDRKSTRLNSSHSQISYAVFCLKKKKIYNYVTGALSGVVGICNAIDTAAAVTCNNFCKD